MNLNLCELNRAELFDAYRQEEIMYQRYLMAPPEMEEVAYEEWQAAQRRANAVYKRNKLIA